MKTTTKIDALNKLLGIEEAKKKAERAKSWAMIGIERQSISPEEVAKRAIAAHAAQCDEYKADEDFRALPKPRREWAKEAKKWAEDQARHGFDLGGDYSGNTSQSICWGDSSRAYTIKCYGEKYSRSCKYSKMDAEHIVQLCAEDVARLDGWRQIAQASAAEGLPIIGLMEDGRFIWVRRKGKAIVAENGWIGSHAGTIFHSKKSAEDAQAGAERKAKKSVKAQKQATA